jgi:hypothetical protein
MPGKLKKLDLGSKAWMSIDEGKSGKAHALIFDSPNIIKSGENQIDGIEIQLYQSNFFNLPGIDGKLKKLDW